MRYIRNTQRLGACANTDHCFLPGSISGGAYGYILEDDNFLLPGFLSLIANRLDEKPWQLVQANQRIWSKERGLHPESETIRRAGDAMRESMSYDSYTLARIALESGIPDTIAAAELMDNAAKRSPPVQPV